MAQGGARVLIVEDDAVIRDTLADLLDLEGYEARAVTDGEQALAVLDDWTPDVILLDLMMPRMDAWAFREEQRRRPAIARIPIVVLSAGRDLPTRTRDLDPTAIIPKPFDLEVVLHTVQRLTSPAG
jgi:CheY-like chemotaxis protein